MADGRDAPGVFWVEPRRRAILPLDGLCVSRSLRKTIASDRFRVTVDRAFPQILQLCAESAADRPDTWISGPIERVFTELHRRGFAHSIECWEGERLAGGLYGLALGRAFFGESMVTRVRDASKVAFAHLVARLKAGGFTLLDCQFQTEHLATLGVVEVPRDDYVALLGAALGDSAAGLSLGAPSVDGDFFALDRSPEPPAVGAGTVSGPLSRKVIAQLLGHTS
jgi:leucyl/phenylalanyl-tRNA--protein transferase